MATSAQNDCMSASITRKLNMAAPSVGTKQPFNGSSLGLSARHSHDLIETVHKGLAYKALELFSQQSGIPILEIAAVMNIPDRTLARRRARRRFAPDESERLLRISRIYEQAVDLFDGDVHSAVAWLRTKRRVLANHAPLNYSATELGAREVENLIGQLEHGIFP
jgi:putative toxin-antitoxin system antitoxin component (TIGR02293 family)